MEIPDLSKIRRFALAVALVLLTLVFAQVEMETPVKINPLGFPLIIRNPDLLSIALVLASIYALLRYVYYGMLVHPSPMHMRRILLSGRTFYTPNRGIQLEDYLKDSEKEVWRYFPKIGSKILISGSQDNTGCHLELEVPKYIRLLCWIENIDFLLPIFANIFAIAFWIFQRTKIFG